MSLLWACLMLGVCIEMVALPYFKRFWLYFLEFGIQGFVIVQFFIGGTIYLLEGLHWLRHGENDPLYRTFIYDGLYEPLATEWIGLNKVVNDGLEFLFSPLGSVTSALGFIYFWSVVLDKDLGDFEDSIWIYSPLFLVVYLLAV